MANIIEVVKRAIRPYQMFLLIALIFIVFLVAARYAFKRFYLQNVKNSDNKFKNVANSNNRNVEVPVYFFHVDWCPHCKHALPEWNNFKKDYDGKEINGYIVKCVTTNCTEETSEITKIINDFHIDSYPTVKMVKDGQKIEFDSKITHNTLEQFVNTMLQ